MISVRRVGFIRFRLCKLDSGWLVRGPLVEIVLELLLPCEQAGTRRDLCYRHQAAHPNVYPMFPILLPGIIGPPIAPVGMVGNSVLEKSKPAAQS